MVVSRVILFVTSLTFCCTVAYFVQFSRKYSAELVSISIAPNNLLNVDVPVTQLATTKVGDIVQGQVKTVKGIVSWTGAITSGTKISPTQGCVTVRVISDKYIAPGTPVSGKVGNANFMGTVVGSPNHQERMGNIERRLKALEPENREEILVLQSRLKDLKSELKHLEGHKTISERMEALDKEIIKMEKAPPTDDSLTFKGNIAGMHFVGGVTPIGTTGLTHRLDQIGARISKVEERPTPDALLGPAEERIKKLEEEVNELTKPGGIYHARKEMTDLEKQLAQLENRYGTDRGTNSKWYGTAKYHGMDRPPAEFDADMAPSGTY